VHRKQSHLAALGEDGQVVLSRRVRTRPEEFLRVFGELEPEPFEVVFESTFGWGWLADLLADAGIPAHMAHPLATKAIAAGRVKNDAVDARTLAHLLRGNLLPEAWMAPPKAREARRLARMRASLMRVSSLLKCQVHAVLAEHGVTPVQSDAFGKQGRGQLSKVVLPEISQHRVEANLRLIDRVASEVKLAERELTSLFAKDPRGKATRSGRSRGPTDPSTPAGSRGRRSVAISRKSRSSRKALPVGSGIRASRKRHFSALSAATGGWCGLPERPHAPPRLGTITEYTNCKGTSRRCRRSSTGSWSRSSPRPNRTIRPMSVPGGSESDPGFEAIPLVALRRYSLLQIESPSEASVRLNCCAASQNAGPPGRLSWPAIRSLWLGFLTPVLGRHQVSRPPLNAFDAHSLRPPGGSGSPIPTSR
jgi:hypothetical protein